MVKKSGNNVMWVLLIFAISFLVVTAVNLVDELISPDPDVIKFDTTQPLGELRAGITLCTSSVNTQVLFCDDGLIFELDILRQDQFDTLIETCSKGSIITTQKCIGNELELTNVRII